MSHQSVPDQPVPSQSVPDHFVPDQPNAISRPPQSPPRHLWILPTIGFALVVASAIVQGAGIAQASAHNWGSGTQLALVAIVLSAAAFLVGLAAVILNRRRSFGALVMLLSVLVNPIVLVQLFRVLG